MDLHVQVVGVRVKRRRAGSPSRSSPSKGRSSNSSGGEPWDSYCLATAGTVSLRTCCVAAAAQPRWDEELVFSHVLEDGPHRPSVRFDIFQHGALADSRLMYTDLDLTKMAPPPFQAQQKQAATHHKAGSLSGSSTAYTLSLPLQADPGLLQSAAAVGAAPGEAAAAVAGGGRGGSDAQGSPGRRRRSLLAGRAAARAGSMRGVPGATLVGQELEVVVWWSKQQIMTNAGVPPIVISCWPSPNSTPLVNPQASQQPPALPSCTAGPHAVVYEEPCTAMVKVMVNNVNLGLTIPCWTYQQLAAWLNQVANNIVHQVKSGVQPTQLDFSVRHHAAAAAAAGGGNEPQSQRSSRSGTGPAEGGAGLEGWSEEEEELAWQELDAFDTASSWGGDGPGSSGAEAASRSKEQPVYVEVAVTMGETEPLRQLHPVKVELDGCAAMHQSAVFVTTRPLAGHAEVQLVLNLRQGQRKRPFICLSFSYTLAQLLEFSPAQPAGFETWAALLRSRLPGIRVPLPGLPGAYLELAAFLADMDFRAGAAGLPALQPTPFVWPEWGQREQELQQGRPQGSSPRQDGCTGVAAGGGGGAGEGPAEGSYSSQGLRRRVVPGSSQDPQHSSSGSSGSFEKLQCPADLASPAAATTAGRSSDGGLSSVGSGGPGLASAQLRVDASAYSQGGVVSRRQMVGRLFKASLAKAKVLVKGEQVVDSTAVTTVAVAPGGLDVRYHPSLEEQVATAAGGGGTAPGSSSPQTDPEAPVSSTAAVAGGGVASGAGSSVGHTTQAVAGSTAADGDVDECAPRVMVRGGSMVLRRQPQQQQPGQPLAAYTAAATPYVAPSTSHGTSGASSSSSKQPVTPVSSSASQQATAGGPAAAASSTPTAAAAAGAAAAAVSLEAHPNVCVARCGWREAPLARLQCTIRELVLREAPGSGLQLLVRAGPHWVNIPADTLPLIVADSRQHSRAAAAAAAASTPGSPLARAGPSYSTDAEGSGLSSGLSRTASEQQQQLQLQQAPVLLEVPVYSNSLTLTLLLHRKGVVVARLVARLHGVLPLLVRQHRSTLYFHKCKSRSRKVIGRMLVTFDAVLPPQHPGALGLARVWAAYLSPIQPKPYLAVAMRSSISRDEQDRALAGLVADWLTEGAEVELPKAAVRQVLATGRSAASARRAAAHLVRLKAALLDWVPAAWLDPLAFYWWERPWYNVWVLWVLSHVCLYPAKWMLVMSLLATVWLCRGAAIRLRRGILITEVDELLLPPELAEPGPDDASMAGTNLSGVTASSGAASSLRDGLTALRHGLTTGGTGGSPRAGTGHHHSAKGVAKQLQGKLVNAGDRLLISAGRKLGMAEQLAGRRGGEGGTGGGRGDSSSGAATLKALQAQLMEGRLDLQQLDFQALITEMCSKRGALRMMRTHAPYLWQYALIAQNMLDDAASIAEGFYSLATGVDIACTFILCCALLAATSFMYCFGVGAGVYVLLVFLLRPPLLRGVPGTFGWKPFMRQLPCRSVEEMA